LERHCLGTQTFVPMGGARYVVLVALGDEQPDVATLAAFAVTGRQAVTLRAGTWHHGLIAPHGGDFAVIERRADAVDCELAMLATAVTLV
jgi:ureidoglycolate lyase